MKNAELSQKVNLEDFSWEEEFVMSHEDSIFGSADPSERLNKLDNTDVFA